MSVNTMQLNAFRPDQRQTISQLSEQKEEKIPLNSGNCHNEEDSVDTSAEVKSQTWVDLYQAVFKTYKPMLMRGVMLISAFVVYAIMTGGWVDIGDMFYAILIEWVPQTPCYIPGR